MRTILRAVLSGTMFVATATAPAWAADPGARTTGAYSNGTTPGTSVSDRVTSNVSTALRGDRLLRGAVITVATSESGVVTLVGMVPNVTAKQQAVELARSTPGVTSVNDQLRLSIRSPQAPAR